MPNWKKVIVSGSNAVLNNITSSGNISASGNITGLSGSFIQLSSSYIDLKSTADVDAPGYKEGRLYYNAEDGALTVYNDEADVSLQVGQEFWVRVKNNSGDDILNGTPVYISGSQGDRPTIFPAIAQDHISNEFEGENHIIGVVTHDILDTEEGYATAQGIVRGVDTTAFNAGDTLYIQTGSPATPEDYYRTTPPPYPYDTIRAGWATKIGSNGFIFVEPKTPTHLFDVNNISGSAFNAEVGAIIIKQSGGGFSYSKNLSGSYTINNGALNVVGNITSSGNISASGDFTGNSFIKGGGTSAQFLKADGSVDSTSYGTGTVTEVTVGTGLDVSNGTTTPNVTLDLTEITVGAGLDTTATGISLDLTEVGLNGKGSSNMITDDGDGTVTSHDTLTYDGRTLTVLGAKGIDGVISASVDIYAGSFITAGKGFIGDLTGTADNAGTATNATNVDVANDTGNANHPITFIDDTSPDGGYEALKANANITVNPSEASLSLTKVIATDITASSNITASIVRASQIIGSVQVGAPTIAASDSVATNLIEEETAGGGIEIDTTKANFTGNITASGNISASGDIIVRDGIFTRDNISKVEIIGLDSVGGIVGTDTDHDLVFRRNNTEGFRLGPGNHITASGAISSSGTITSAGLITTKDTDGGDTVIQIINSNTDGGVDKGAGIEFLHGSALGALSGNQRAGKILSTKASSYQGTTAAVDSNLEFYTANNDTDTLQLKINNEGLAAFTGNVSSSGKVYSTNRKSLQCGFQSVASAVQGTWYGTNNLGPNNTYWATTYGTAAAPGSVGLSGGNSGWFVPVKAFVTDATLYIQNISNTTNYAVTGALQLTNTITYPVTAASTFNTTTDYTGDLYSTTGVQYAMEEVTITVNQEVEAGVIMYPRFNVNGTTANWRGTFKVNYYEVK